MSLTQWTHIVIHHSATKDEVTLDFDDFRRYHRLERGWVDVGYNYGIEKIQQGYEILVGRPLTRRGSHAGPDWNGKAIGVVFAGNFNLGAPPVEMMRTASYRLLRPLVATFNIPRGNMIGHRDTKKTDCPGTQFDLGLLKRMVWS